MQCTVTPLHLVFKPCSDCIKSSNWCNFRKKHLFLWVSPLQFNTDVTHSLAPHKAFYSSIDSLWQLWRVFSKVDFTQTISNSKNGTCLLTAFWSIGQRAVNLRISRTSSVHAAVKSTYPVCKVWQIAQFEALNLYPDNPSMYSLTTEDVFASAKFKTQIKQQHWSKKPTLVSTKVSPHFSSVISNKTRTGYRYTTPESTKKASKITNWWWFLNYGHIFSRRICQYLSPSLIYWQVWSLIGQTSVLKSPLRKPKVPTWCL